MDMLRTTFQRCDRPSFAKNIGVFRSMGHTVKIILQDDLPGGKAYAGDVINVRAGYARNFLIPTKKAFYATPENLKRFGVNIDMAEKREESQIEEVSEDKKMADILRSYLKHKTLLIRRNADRSSGRIYPGKVTAVNVKSKLSRQLKIVLEDHEKIILHPEKINLSEVGDDFESLVSDQSLALEDIPSCATEVTQLGDYYAKIYLRGGFVVPLHVQVLKR